VRLTRGQQDSQRLAERVDQGMDFELSPPRPRPMAWSSAFLGAPALCRRGRTTVLSIIAHSLAASAARGSTPRCRTPFLAQRLNRRWVFFQPPKRSGRSRPRNSGAIAVPHRFLEPAIVVLGCAKISGFTGEQICYSLPLIIAQSLRS